MHGLEGFNQSDLSLIFSLLESVLVLSCNARVVPVHSLCLIRLMVGMRVIICVGVPRETHDRDFNMQLVPGRSH